MSIQIPRPRVQSTPDASLSLSAVQGLRGAQRITIEIHVDPDGRARSRLTLDVGGPPDTVGFVLRPQTSVVDYDDRGSRKLDVRLTLSGSAEPWRTVAALLGEGDVLELVLAVDAGNEYITRANLHLDKLGLRIHRPGEGVFIPLAQTVAPDNFARLVQR